MPSSCSLSPLSLSSFGKSLAIAVFVLVIVSMLAMSDALRCYTCSYVANTESLDFSCINDPKHETNCTKKYCTITRQELLKPDGKVISFSRGCEDKPLYLNAVKTDATYKMTFRSCTSDLCNDSDGKNSATKVDPDFGAAPNMIIKGRKYKVDI